MLPRHRRWAVWATWSSERSLPMLHHVLSGPFVLAAAVLAVGGAMKLVRPGPAAGALAALHIPAAAGRGAADGSGRVGCRFGGAGLRRAGGGAGGRRLLSGVRRFCRCGDVGSYRGRFLWVFRPGGCAPGSTHLVIDLVAAGVCLTAALVAPPSGIVDLVATQPWAGIPFLAFLVIGVAGVVMAMTELPRLERGPGRSVSVRLVDAGSRFLAARTSRRGFLRNAALVGSALVTAPVAYTLRPVSAYSAICSCSGSSCDCSALCCDGYTEFCCTLYGSNSCPSGTLAAGWWKADVSGFCVQDGADLPRYCWASTATWTTVGVVAAVRRGRAGRVVSGGASCGCSAPEPAATGRRAVPLFAMASATRT